MTCSFCRYAGYDNINEELYNVKELKKAWNEASKISCDSDDRTIAKFCYTLEWPNFYRVCNKELRKWYNAQNKKSFPFNNYVKLLESQCLKFDKGLTLYRGMKNQVGKYLMCYKDKWKDKRNSFEIILFYF